ncbi:hypothetical protein HJC23_010647 [Cyclotella cryptica]|uniref:SAM domain-containing protein n=1 Tax=Cyclotella cryptica TaxID=29204 RepID=A0ABD3PFX9_9STRA|eukprot:CCRYP_014846-RA/>CCRYP_014846-RA protein AED:0.04 eAED:0.06 QI:0/0/0/1/0/0/2/0/524
MEKLNFANQHLATALKNYDQELLTKTAELDEEEHRLIAQLNSLENKKLTTFHLFGDVNARGDDIIEINAGGRIIVTKHSTLTQVKGSRLEKLFSGRWDKALLKDRDGRVFLDVNPVGFEAVLDYLNEVAISSDEETPPLPYVDSEHSAILRSQIELFGLSIINMPGKEDSYGDFNLIYRGSSDCMTPQDFHAKCNDKGPTITIIETTEGHVVGGYSNVSWASCGSYCEASEAFLFALAQNWNSSSCKMTVTVPATAVYFHPIFGPVFGNGNDLKVRGSSVYTYTDQGSPRSYECHSLWPLKPGQEPYMIKDIEVFQIVEHKPTGEAVGIEENFSKEINEAISAKWISLLEASAGIKTLEDRMLDEEEFVTSFASSQHDDVITLNVRGTIMVTCRSTLQLRKESCLAIQFSNEELKKQGTDKKTIQDWNYEDVVAWLNQREGLSESIVKEFNDNQVTGRELIAFDAEALKDFGVTQKGAAYLLLDEIKKLETASAVPSIFIEHNQYCFGKVVDQPHGGVFYKGSC